MEASGWDRYECYSWENWHIHKLDSIDNELGHPAAREVIEKLCVRNMVCKNQHDCYERLLQFTEEKYLLGFIEKQDEAWHFMALTINPFDGLYDVDEITYEAIELPTL